jgi:hypothetical protein
MLTTAPAPLRSSKIRRLLVVAAILVAGSASGGDDSSKPEIWPELSRTQRQKREPKAKRFFLFAGTSLVGDTNVDHTVEERSDTGVVPLAGLEFRNRSDRSRVNLGYTIASHHYSKSDAWDRTSHDPRLYESRASRRWRPPRPDVSLDGTAEDRTWRTVTASSRPRVLVQPPDSVPVCRDRQKDYLNDQLTRDNPYAGVEFQQELRAVTGGASATGTRSTGHRASATATSGGPLGSIPAPAHSASRLHLS